MAVLTPRNARGRPVTKLCLALESLRRTEGEGRTRDAQAFLGHFFPLDRAVATVEAVDRLFVHIPNEVRAELLSGWGIRGKKSALRDDDEKVRVTVADALRAGDIDATGIEQGVTPEILVDWVPLEDWWSFWRGSVLPVTSVRKALSLGRDLSLFDERWFLEHLSLPSQKLASTDAICAALSKEQVAEWIGAVQKSGDASPTGLIAALGWETVLAKTAHEALVTVLDALARQVGLADGPTRVSSAPTAHRQSSLPPAAATATATAPAAATAHAATAPATTAHAATAPAAATAPTTTAPATATATAVAAPAVAAHAATAHAATAPATAPTAAAPAVAAPAATAHAVATTAAPAVAAPAAAAPAKVTSVPIKATTAKPVVIAQAKPAVAPALPTSTKPAALPSSSAKPETATAAPKGAPAATATPIGGAHTFIEPDPFGPSSVTSPDPFGPAYAASVSAPPVSAPVPPAPVSAPPTARALFGAPAVNLPPMRAKAHTLVGVGETMFEAKATELATPTFPAPALIDPSWVPPAAEPGDMGWDIVHGVQRPMGTHVLPKYNFQDDDDEPTSEIELPPPVKG